MFKKVDEWVSKNPGEFLTLFFIAITFAVLFLLMLVLAGDVFLRKI